MKSLIVFVIALCVLGVTVFLMDKGFIPAYVAQFAIVGIIIGGGLIATLFSKGLSK